MKELYIVYSLEESSIYRLLLSNNTYNVFKGTYN